MAERTAKPAAKTALGKAPAGKSKNLKTAPVAAPRKTAVKKATSAAERKSPVKKAVVSTGKPAARRAMGQPTPEERYRMVQTAAYFIAERDGFCGCPTEYWSAAELEIASRLGA